MLNAVPALEDLACELARNGRATKAVAKLHCSDSRGTTPAMKFSILNRNLDSEPII